MRLIVWPLGFVRQVSFFYRRGRGGRRGAKAKFWFGPSASLASSAVKSEELINPGLRGRTIETDCDHFREKNNKELFSSCTVVLFAFSLRFGVAFCGELPGTGHHLVTSDALGLHALAAQFTDELCRSA